MIAYAVEKWRDVLPEMEPILYRHWLEIALGHDKVPLDIARDKYQALCDAGILHVVTVRQDGELVGYHVGMIQGHLHYRSTLHGITDVYYLSPAHRKGRTGIRMFQFVEAEMRKLGVKKLFTGCKLHTADGKSGKLFEYLGYNKTEELFTKWIGG